jgi:hypothetical protein
VQVGTYPTRNFATLGTVVTHRRSRPVGRSLQWAESFLLSSACRHTGRTVSSPSFADHGLVTIEPRVQSLRILPIPHSTCVLAVSPDRSWRTWRTPNGQVARPRVDSGIVQISHNPFGVETSTRQSSFLLIVRTGRIVTARAAPYDEGVARTSTAGYSGFPAYSGVLQRPVANSPL